MKHLFKKIFDTTIRSFVVMLLLAPAAFAATGMGGGIASPAYWYLDGTTLKPVNSSWSVWIPVGGTSDGAFTVDVTDTEALLIRKDGDTGDVFTVNTDAGTVTIGTSTAVSSIIDDDTMGTASAVSLATSESIVAYIASAIGSFAPTDATYITQTANGTLSAEQALGALATGILKNTTTTGVLSIAADGVDYLASLVADTTPQLGGDLDANGNDISGVVQLGLAPSADEARLDDSAVTCSNSLNRVVGSGGAVILDTDPAIVDGAYDGQLCMIQGTDDTNTVQIVDNVNTALAGDVSFTLGKGNILTVVWDAGDSLWYEVSRADN